MWLKIASAAALGDSGRVVVKNLKNVDACQQSVHKFEDWTQRYVHVHGFYSGSLEIDEVARMFRECFADQPDRRECIRMAVNRLRKFQTPLMSQIPIKWLEWKKTLKEKGGSTCLHDYGIWYTSQPKFTNREHAISFFTGLSNIVDNCRKVNANPY